MRRTGTGLKCTLNLRNDFDNIVFNMCIIKLITNINYIILLLKYSTMGLDKTCIYKRVFLPSCLSIFSSTSATHVTLTMTNVDRSLYMRRSHPPNKR